MRRQFSFNLGQSSGEYYVTASAEAKDAPSFMFVGRTRQEAIDLACRGISTWLQYKKTPPKSKFTVDKTAKYEPAKLAEGAVPPKPQKFGGLPIKKVTPNETITVGVDI